MMEYQKPRIGRPPKDAPPQKYSREAIQILGRMNKARTVGRVPLNQLHGLATYIRGEAFWRELFEQPIEVRAMLMEAHAKSWARLSDVVWKRGKPF